MAVKARAEVTLMAVVDVASTTRYYLLQSSTLAKPAKPTAADPGGWSETEPSYTAGSTNSLYTVDKTTYSDGTFAYSEVSLSSSYEAAKLAYNEAQAAASAAAAAKMFYCACNTASSTAAKAPASTVAGFSLYSGVAVTVKFTYANTASAPTLDVNSTGAKQIRLFGAAYNTWLAGAVIVLVYDGTYWQVSSEPLRASEVTVGDPTGGNVHLDSDSVEMRKGSVVLASIAASLVRLGIDSDEAVVDLVDGLLKIRATTYGSKSWAEVKAADSLAMLAPHGKTVHIGTYSADGAYSDIGIGISSDASGSDYPVILGDLEINGGFAHGGHVINSNTGTGTITLTQKPATFEYLEIIYSYAGIFGSCRIVAGTGKRAALSLSYPDDKTPTACWFKTRLVSINESSITNSKAGGWVLNYPSSGQATNITTSVEISIERVIGYR